jgi:predicted enzyme related to lactoylglutathione lyase
VTTVQCLTRTSESKQGVLQMSLETTRAFRWNYAAAAALLALTGMALPGVRSASAASAAPVMPALADPATNTPIPGKFVWFDLASSDAAASQRFYGKVFDWKFQQVRGTAEKYAVIRNEGRSIGGVFSRKPSGAVVGARWLSFVRSNAMDRGCAMTAGGGRYAASDRSPGRGTHAVARLTGRNHRALLQSSSGDRADAPVEAGNSSG